MFVCRPCWNASSPKHKNMAVCRSYAASAVADATAVSGNGRVLTLNDEVRGLDYQYLMTSVHKTAKLAVP